MRAFLSLILSACMIGCADLQYTATNAITGNTETVKYRPTGGSEALQTPGGFKYAGNRNASFKQFMQFATMSVSAAFAFWTYQVGQLTQQMQNANLSQVQKLQISSDLKLALAQQQAALKQGALTVGLANNQFTPVPFPTPKG